jgi:polyhydroxyalkanoate synthesis regulator phasin
MAMLLYTAGEEIDKKIEDYKKKRDDNCGSFEEEARKRREKIEAFIEDEKKKMKERINSLADKMGFVSRSEVDRLKQEIEALSAKLDSLNSRG